MLIYIKLKLKNISTMKRFFAITLIIFFIITLFYINFNYHNSNYSIDKIEQIHKDNWKEALMEFGDEDDTLDSLDYVPEWIR